MRISYVFFTAFFIMTLRVPYSLAEMVAPTIQNQGVSEYIVNSGEVLTGKEWKEFDFSKKENILLGFKNGFLGIGLIEIAEKEDLFYDDIEQAIMEYDNALPVLDKPYHYDQVIRKIDDFYSDSFNINIPLFFVVLIVRNQLAEEDPESIKQYIKYLYFQFPVKPVAAPQDPQKETP